MPCGKTGDFLCAHGLQSGAVRWTAGRVATRAPHAPRPLRPRETVNDGKHGGVRTESGSSALRDCFPNPAMAGDPAFRGRRLALEIGEKLSPRRAPSPTPRRRGWSGGA